jgi:DNA-binding IclR family transcriptional regulator
MNPSAAPSPVLFFDTINAYQKSAALRAAIELELFSAIGQEPATATELAARMGHPHRGVRILADYLVILGFLTKAEGRYALTPIPPRSWTVILRPISVSRSSSSWLRS